MGKRVTTVETLLNEFQENLCGRKLIYIAGTNKHSCLNDGDEFFIAGYNNGSAGEDNPYSIKTKSGALGLIHKTRRVILLPD